MKVRLSELPKDWRGNFHWHHAITGISVNSDAYARFRQEAELSVPDLSDKDKHAWAVHAALTHPGFKGQPKFKGHKVAYFETAWRLIVLGLLAFIAQREAHCQTATLPAVAHATCPTVNEGQRVALCVDLNGNLQVSSSGGGGGNVNVTQWASTALGAPSNYGTSPGLVTVPGVNAFVTNTPAVSQSGVWTVGGSGNFTVVQSSGANLHVDCDSGCSGAASFSDNAAFTAGSTSINITGGWYSTSPTNCSTGSACAPELTQDRKLYVQDFQGTSPWVVGGTVTANQGGAPWSVSASGNFPVTQSTSPWVVSGSGTFTVSGTVTSNQGTSPWTDQGAGASGTSVTGNPFIIGGSDYGTSCAASTPCTRIVKVDSSGNLQVAVTNTPAVSQSGTWTVQQGGAPWSVSGSGTFTVSGTVTANQGTANSTPWNENLAQINTHTVQEAGINGSLEIGGAVAGSNKQPASTTNPVLMGGSDYGVTPAVQIPKVDSSGNLQAAITNTPTVTANAGSGTFTVGGTVTANAGTGTFTVGGTVTANAGTGNFTVVQSSGGNLHVDVDSVPTTTVTGTVTANAGTGTFTVGGTVTANQGTAAAASAPWPIEVTDGTNGVVAVKAANTTALVGDISHVVQLSPNNAGLPVNLITIVQKTSQTSSGSVASINKAFTSNTKIGNSLIVSFCNGNGNSPTSPITDTLSLTWWKATLVANGTAFECGVWFAFNPTGGADTVTVTPGGTNASIAMEIYEVSGALGIAPNSLNSSQTTTNTASAQTSSPSVSFVPQVDNQYSFVAFGLGTAAQTITVATQTSTSPYANDSGQLNPATPSGLFSMVSASGLLTEIESANPSASVGVGEPWAVAQVCFKPVTVSVEGSVNLQNWAGTALGTPTPFGTSPGAVIAGSVNSSLFLGTTTAATASSGVQKVGIVGGSAGTSLETTNGVLDTNLKNVNNSAVATGLGTATGALRTSQGFADTPTTGPILCENVAKYDASTSGATQLVAASGSTRVYVCGFNFFSAGTVNVKLMGATSGTCATTTDLTPAYQLTAQTGIVEPVNNSPGLKTAASSQLCINTSAGVAVQALVWYSQF